MAALVAVVEEGSFERAATRLRVTPSAVSQRIKQLELRLGTVVVGRSNPCLPTPAGEALVRFGKQVAHLAAEAIREMDPGRDAPTAVAVAVNADSLATWFLDALAPFATHAETTFELVVDDQAHTADLLRAGRVLAAVTAEPTAVRGCRIVSLGAMRYVAVASRRYLERHFPGGVTKTALTRAPVLAFNRKDGLQHDLLRKLVGRRVEPPAHLIPSSRGFVAAARMGLGWGMVPAAMASEVLASGELRRLRRDAWLDVPLYWQHWRLETPTLRRLTGEVERAARRMNDGFGQRG